MKNRVTIQSLRSNSAQSALQANQVPPNIVPRLVAVGALLLVINLLFMGQTWVFILNILLTVIGPTILVSAVVLKTKDNRQVQPGRGQIHYDDPVAQKIPWSALRPHVTGESRNCKVCKHSTSSKLLFKPLFGMQYLCVIIVTIVAAAMTAIAISGSLPQIHYSGTVYELDPSLKVFIYLFGTAVITYVGFLLRKPVRALEFDKQKGVFWIEKHRIFGWKVGESAQMPLNQIHALQLISYTNREVYAHYKDQIKAAGHPAPSFISSDQRSIREHELNIVFSSGERVNVINHRNGKAIHNDASVLASFLDVPVWDRDLAEKEAYMARA